MDGAVCIQDRAAPRMMRGTALLLYAAACAWAPATSQQQQAGNYDAPVGGYCRGPGGQHQGVNGLSCPGVADLASCQRGCDLNRPRCVAVHCMMKEELRGCGCSASAAGPAPAARTICRRGRTKPAAACRFSWRRCIGYTWRPHSDRTATDLDGNGIIDPDEYSDHDHSLCSIKGAGMGKNALQ